MAEKKFIKEKKIIKNYFKEHSLSLNKIILFGSHATKVNHKDSDIDLLIISKDFKGLSIYEKAKLMCNLDWQLVKEAKAPYDILYYSEEDWNNSNSITISDAKREGKFIYP